MGRPSLDHYYYPWDKANWLTVASIVYLLFLDQHFLKAFWLRPRAWMCLCNLFIYFYYYSYFFAAFFSPDAWWTVKKKQKKLWSCSPFFLNVFLVFLNCLEWGILKTAWPRALAKESRVSVLCLHDWRKCILVEIDGWKIISDFIFWEMLLIWWDFTKETQIIEGDTAPVLAWVYFYSHTRPHYEEMMSDILKSLEKDIQYIFVYN